MGQIISSESDEHFIDKIHYFQTVEDSNYGKLDIYHLTEPPYEYILDFTKSYIEANDQMSSYLDLMTRVKALTHDNIAKIHATMFKEDQQLCVIHKKVHVYCNYYNFTFEQAITKKKTAKAIFSEGDIVHIMNSLLDVAVKLKENSLVFGNYRAESIYLSPEGQVKIYLLDLDSQNKHASYYTVLSQNNRLSEFILAPEQLLAIKKLEYKPSYSIYKAELFSIAMVVLELMTLDRAKFYYNEARMEIMTNKATFSLDMYTNKYSKRLIDIIKLCLQPNPEQRPELEQCLELIKDLRSKLKNKVYSIKFSSDAVIENEEESVTRPKGQYILNSLAKKLNPSPISTISSSSASLYNKERSRGITLKNKLGQSSSDLS